jgi:hypothetical protein
MIVKTISPGEKPLSGGDKSSGSHVAVSAALVFIQLIVLSYGAYYAM